MTKWITIRHEDGMYDNRGDNPIDEAIQFLILLRSNDLTLEVQSLRRELAVCNKRLAAARVALGCVDEYSEGADE